MQRIRFLATVLGACLAFSICSRADVVTQPLRKFGLGDLLQVAISPDRQWMATAGSGGAFLWDFEAGVVVHRRLKGVSPPLGPTAQEFGSPVLDAQVGESWGRDSPGVFSFEYSVVAMAN